MSSSGSIVSDASSTSLWRHHVQRRWHDDDSSVVPSDFDASAAPSDAPELARPSHRLKNRVESIDSLLAFCHYLSEFPEYLFESDLHRGRSLTSNSGRQHFPCLGAGASFEVSSATVAELGGDDKSKDLVAIKVPTPTGGPLGSDEARKAWETRMLREIASELSCMTQKPIRSSKNVARYLSVTWRASFLEEVGNVRMMPSIVMEKAELGTLNDLFHDDVGPLSAKMKWKLSTDIAKGMEVLESCGVVHGDLKASNILIFSDPNEDGLLAKVTDFGFAMRNFNWAGKKSTLFKGGSPPWDAPELTACYEIGQVTLDLLARADIYSYGLLLWRLALNGQTPFDSREFACQYPEFGSLLDDTSELNSLAADMKMNDELFLGHVLATITQHQHQIPEEFGSALDQCLKKDPSARAPSFNTILGSLGCRTVSGQNATPTTTSAEDILRHGRLSLPSTERKFMTIGMSTRQKPTILEIQRWVKGDQIPARVQQSIFRDIHHRISQRGAQDVLDEALCYFLGFGVAPDFDQGLSLMTEAACAGEIRAMALVGRIHRACKRDQPVGFPWVQWLCQAASEGSIVAVEELRLCQHRDNCNDIRLAHQSKYKYGILRRHLDHEVVQHLENVCRYLESMRSWIQSNSHRQFEDLTPYSFTALHIVAIGGGECAVVDFLVDQGVDVDQRNFTDETPLLCALRAGHVDIARTLLKRGADPTLATILGETPLHHIAFLEADAVPDTLQLLLEHGAGIDAVSSGTEASTFFSEEEFLYETRAFYGTPLMWAVQARRIDVVRELLQHGADPTASQAVNDDNLHDVVFEGSEPSMSPLFYAAHNSDAEIVKELLGHPKCQALQTEQGMVSKRDILGQPDFVLMCLHGDSYKRQVNHTIELLFPTEPLERLMIDAVSGNCVAFLESLVDRGADIDKWDASLPMTMTPLQMACARDIPGVMALKLLDLGADPLKQSPDIPGTCLSVLVFNRLAVLTLPIVKRMMQRGFTYDEQIYSFTMLWHKAIRENDEALCEFLLSQDGVSRKSLEEKSPMGSLLFSLILDNTQASIVPIEALVRGEMPPSIFTDKPFTHTVFHALASIPEENRNEGLNERLASLFFHEYNPGAEVLDALDSQGQTAMSVAVSRGNHRLLRLLLRNGADPHVGKFSIPVCFIRRITGILDVPKTGSSFAARLRWRQKVHRLQENTVRLICAALEQMNDDEGLKALPRQRHSYHLIDEMVKRWREEAFYMNAGIKAMQELVGDSFVVSTDGTRMVLQEANGGTKNVSIENMVKASEMMWHNFLSELLSASLAKSN